MASRALVVTRSGEDERTVDLSHEDVLVGRREECAIRASGDDTLGRRHARISYRDGDHWIEDLGSDNGTWVNGERVTMRRALTAGDVIQCGRLEIRYVETTA